jgi:hypothetical protein
MLKPEVHRNEKSDYIAFHTANGSGQSTEHPDRHPARAQCLPKGEEHFNADIAEYSCRLTESD